MAPVPYQVIGRHTETRDSITLHLRPVDGALPAYQPGQFTMLYSPGIGEIAVSISGAPPTARDALIHTIRDVGAVSHALHETPPGSLVGIRGPFGTAWNLRAAVHRDVVVVAGGVGLAPLRPVILTALAQRPQFGRIVLVAGARTPDEFLFADELNKWANRGDIEVLRTVDRPGPGWAGAIGFVTEPLARLKLDTARSTAFLCGPEPMMRFSARILLDKGLSASHIQVSLERNMKCGVGLCGHCQLGPLLVCRDGPVVNYATAEPLLLTREL
jgi:NAD(P)H-flavin reductase